MSKVIISVATVLADLPSGVVAGNKRFSILDSTGAVVQTQDVADITATFSNVVDGTYTPTVQDLDSNSNNLGAVVTGDTFTVSNVVVPPAQYNASSTISVVVSSD